MPEKTLSDIHDIKPPVPIPAFEPGTWLYPLLIGLALIALIWGLVWFLRRRRRAAQGFKPQPVSPAEAANRALDELREVDGFDGREFYFMLTMIPREYIRGKFGLNAPEMTTQELLPFLKQLPMGIDMQGALREMLLHADPIKFADIGTTESRMRRDHTLVRELIREIEGREEAPDEAEPVTETGAGQTGRAGDSGKTETLMQKR